MNPSSLFVPSGITADIPPPFPPTSPLGLIFFLLFCAAAFLCLRRFFRRSKDSVLKIEEGDAGKSPRPASVNGHPALKDESLPERQTEPGQTGEVRKTT